MRYFTSVNEHGLAQLGRLTEVNEIVQEAHQLAQDGPVSPITFVDGDGTRVKVAADSDPGLIIRDWKRARRGYLDKFATVGPYPAETLSQEELTNDNIIADRNAERVTEAASKLEAEDREHALRVLTRLQHAPAVEFAGKQAADLWQEWEETNKDDTSGLGAIAFARNWAQLMQLEMAQGRALSEIWEYFPGDCHLREDAWRRGQGSPHDAHPHLEARRRTGTALWA